MLDMTDCLYEQFDEKTTRITGQKYIPIEGDTKVKLEGSGLVGEKYIGVAGIRDPYSIANIDKVIELTRDQVREEFKDDDYHLNFRIYGKNGVMGEMEPITEIKSHELGIVIEGIADSMEMAEAVTLMATRQLFYARLPEVKGTAGTAAFVVDEVLRSTPSYSWTMNHVLPVKDPMELFQLHVIDITADEPALAH
jgi:hypothetical protein